MCVPVIDQLCDVLKCVGLVWWDGTWISPAQLQAAAKMIYDTYLSVSAPQQINIDDRVLKDVEASLNNPTVHIFVEAQNQVCVSGEIINWNLWFTLCVRACVGMNIHWKGVCVCSCSTVWWLPSLSLLSLSLPPSLPFFPSSLISFLYSHFNSRYINLSN